VCPPTLLCALRHFFNVLCGNRTSFSRPKTAAKTTVKFTNPVLITPGWNFGEAPRRCGNNGVLARVKIISDLAHRIHKSAASTIPGEVNLHATGNDDNPRRPRRRERRHQVCSNSVVTPHAGSRGTASAAECGCSAPDKSHDLWLTYMSSVRSISAPSRVRSFIDLNPPVQVRAAPKFCPWFRVS
jgi:hypothetical protein